MPVILPILHLHDAVGEFVDSTVVGNDDDAALVGENVFAHKLDDVAPGIAVERGGRLIENQDLGPTDDGARDGDALLLAAAELDRRQLRAILEPNDFQVLRRPP